MLTKKTFNTGFGKIDVVYSEYCKNCPYQELISSEEGVFAPIKDIPEITCKHIELCERLVKVLNNGSFTSIE